jgi:hypothetical protein
MLARIQRWSNSNWKLVQWMVGILATVDLYIFKLLIDANASAISLFVWTLSILGLLSIVKSDFNHQVQE